MGGKTIKNCRIGIISHSFSLGKFYRDISSTGARWQARVPAGCKFFPPYFHGGMGGSTLGAWDRNSNYSGTNDYGNAWHLTDTMVGNIQKAFICNILGEDFWEYDTITGTCEDIIGYHLSFITDFLIARCGLKPKDILWITGYPLNTDRTDIGSIDSSDSNYKDAQGNANHNSYIFSQEAATRLNGYCEIANTFNDIIDDYGTTDSGINSFAATYLTDTMSIHTTDTTGPIWMQKYLDSYINDFLF